MRRYDPDIAYIGQGEYVPEMSEHEDGEYVRYVGHSGAVHAAVRDTQRRMIAALYWRAGATMVLAERAESRRQHAKCDRLCNAAAGAFSAAQAMEAACAR